MGRYSIAGKAAALLGAALVVAGCGGGEAPPADAVTPTPTPGATTPGATAADPNAVPVDANGDGMPDDPTAVGGPSATAEIADLQGGDIGGGFVGAGSSSSIFKAAASEAVAEEEPKVAEPTTSFPDLGTGTGTDVGGEAPDPGPDYTGARVYVDGIVHSVSLNDTFPEANPVFQLVSVSGSSIEVQLIAGEFVTGGGDATLLDKGDLVSLVNSSEQLTYRIKYMSPIVGASDMSF